MTCALAVDPGRRLHDTARMSLFLGPKDPVHVTILDDRCGTPDVEAWKAFFEWSFGVIGRPFKLQITHGFESIVDKQAFCLVSSTWPLSFKLLSRVATLFVAPSGPPLLTDPWLASLGSAPNGFSRADHLHKPRLALLTSVFKGDAELPSFFENMAELTDYSSAEHWLIRANSPGQEHEQLALHVKAYPNAVYVNLLHDPGLYEVWNLAMGLSNAHYLSNANLDDRRAPDQIAYLRGHLQKDSTVDLGCTALRVTEQPGLSWSESAECPVMFSKLSALSGGADLLFVRLAEGLRPRNLPHCMPLWRRRLVTWTGNFDEKRYGPSADWAYWLKAMSEGSRFFFSAEAKGLYFRNPKGYWHRNSEGSSVSVYDKTIIEEFGCHDDLDHSVSAATLRSKRPLSLALESVWKRFSEEDGWGAIALLMTLIYKYSKEDLNRALPMLTLYGKRFFGDDAALSRFEQYAPLFFFNRDLALRLYWLDLVRHVFKGGEQPTPEVRRRLEWGSVSAYCATNDAAYRILVAWIAGASGDHLRERELLSEYCAQEGLSFWAGVQAVYRFEIPLKDLSQRAGLRIEFFSDSDEPGRLSLISYPDFRRSNDYQTMLYDGLEGKGAHVEHTKTLQEFLSGPALRRQRNVLHLHWISPIFSRDRSQPEVLAESQAVLEALRQRQEDGAEVHWTVHNYLSHESRFPALEQEFQGQLSKLVDRLWIHHPATTHLLDWASPGARFGVVEHGANQKPAGAENDKARARQMLGLASDAVVLTHIGQVRSYKGLALQLPKIRECLEAFPKLVVVIAGGLLDSAVQLEISRLSHPRLCVHEGFLAKPTLWNLMTASDFGLLSYDRVLTSGSLFHWLSVGRPVLASRLGNIPNYVVDGWNGLMFSSPIELAGAIQWMMAVSKSQREAMASNAHQVGQQQRWPYQG